MCCDSKTVCLIENRLESNKSVTTGQQLAEYILGQLKHSFSMVKWAEC